jgi:AcrR family transcriptional regulator
MMDTVLVKRTGADPLATKQTGHAALAALLWEPQAGPRRGPRPTLTLEAIARAGVAVADEDGLGAVTMQRVAEAVGVTKMALYRYVPGKDELVALMLDVGIGPAPHPASGHWRADLETWSRALAARFQRHPWAMAATIGTRVMGPNELDWLERAVAALDGTGLTGAEAIDAAAVLAGNARALSEQAAAAGGAGPEDALAGVLAGLLRGREDRFPAIGAAFAETARDGGRDEAFEFGLQRLLDGIEALIAKRRKG